MRTSWLKRQVAPSLAVRHWNTGRTACVKWSSFSSWDRVILVSLSIGHRFCWCYFVMIFTTWLCFIWFMQSVTVYDYLLYFSVYLQRKKHDMAAGTMLSSWNWMPCAVHTPWCSGTSFSPACLCFRRNGKHLTGRNMSMLGFNIFFEIKYILDNIVANKSP